MGAANVFATPRPIAENVCIYIYMEREREREKEKEERDVNVCARVCVCPSVFVVCLVPA